MLNELKQVLQKFNDGYVRRDVDRLDAFMEELFINSPTTVILGTSEGELCLGLEQAKNLIKNDWMYWNDFRVDPEKALFHQVGDAFWFAVVASVKYVFKTDEATNERLLHFPKNQLEAAEKGPLEALTTLSWGLAHYLFPREEAERAYLWPVRLTGVLREDQGRWKFEYIQFCLPSASSPDQRHGTPYLDQLYKGPTFNTAGFEQSPLHGELIGEVRGIVTQLSGGDVAAVAGRFPQQGLHLVITPQDVCIQPGNVAEKLAALQEQMGTLSPDFDHALTFERGDLAWVVCGGIAHKSMDTETALAKQVAELHQLLESDVPAKEKLLRTQLGIVTTIKDIASGSEYNVPFRLEVAFSREGATWAIQTLQISLPFYWIFEDKIPSERI